MTKVMDHIIEARLVASRSRDSSICIACDGYWASRVRAKVSRSFCVCPPCLNSADFDARLKARAEEFMARAEKFASRAVEFKMRAEEFTTRASDLKQKAASVRTLIGKIEAPPFESWVDAEAQHEAMAVPSKEELKKILAMRCEQRRWHEPAYWDEPEYRARGTEDPGNAEDAARDEFFRTLRDDGEPLDDDIPF